LFGGTDLLDTPLLSVIERLRRYLRYLKVELAWDRWYGVRCESVGTSAVNVRAEYAVCH
jgi:hypothetical protein